MPEKSGKESIVEIVQRARKKHQYHDQAENPGPNEVTFHRKHLHNNLIYTIYPPINS